MSAQELHPFSTPVKQRPHRPISPTRQQQILKDVHRAWSQPLQSLEPTLGFDRDDSEYEDGVDLSDELGDEVQPEQSIHPVYTISASLRDIIEVSQMGDSPTVPIYPPTSKDGVCTFIALDPNQVATIAPEFQNPPQRRPTKEEFKQTLPGIHKFMASIMSWVQHCIAHVDQCNITEIPFLSQPDNKAFAYRRKWKCTGIKCCPYHVPEVVVSDGRWDSVDLSQLSLLRAQSGYKESASQKAAVKARLADNTHAYFNNFKTMWQRHKNFICIGLDGMPCCQASRPRIFIRNGVQFIGCPNKPVTPNGELHIAVDTKPQVGRLDQVLLATLCANGKETSSTSNCVYIGRSTDKRKACGYFHKTGRQPPIQIECGSTLDLYIPCNVFRFPFFLLIGRGSHTHHPVYPDKVPTGFKLGLRAAIMESDTLAMNPSRIYMLPAVQSLIQKWGVTDSLNCISMWLHNEDRLISELRRDRMLKYPDGIGLAGLERELHIDRTRPPADRWVRHIEYLGFNTRGLACWFAVCFLRVQAEAFSRFEFLQMDLSFKMVQGKINVYSINAQHPEYGSAITLAHVFVNSDSPQTYCKLFSVLFEQIYQVSKVPVCFRHIHGSGIRVITVDMCRKQAKGLGLYLQSIDPVRTWSEHLPHLMIFCRTHNNRNFRKMWPEHEFGYVLDLLFNAQSETELDSNLKSLVAKFPAQAGWFENKSVPWIKAGLCKACTEISPDDWDFAHKETGIAEATHWSENHQVGLFRALLAACLALREVMRKQWHNLNIRRMTGLRPYWRDDSLEAQAQRKLTAQSLVKYNISDADRRKANKSKPFQPSNYLMPDKPNMTIRDGSLQVVSDTQTPLKSNPSTVHTPSGPKALGSTFDTRMTPLSQSSHVVHSVDELPSHSELPVQRQLFNLRDSNSVRSPSPLGRDRGLSVLSSSFETSTYKVHTAAKDSVLSSSQASTVVESNQVLTQAGQSSKRICSEIETQNEARRKRISVLKDQLAEKKARKEAQLLEQEERDLLEALEESD